MTALLALSRGIDVVTTFIGKIAWWVTLGMIAIGVFNVVTRYVGRSLGISLGGSSYIVLQTYFFDFVFLAAAAYVLRVDGHVRVDILFSNLSRRARAWVDVAGTVLFLLPFCWMGIHFSLGYVASSWRQGEIDLLAGGLPVYPVKTLIPAAFVLLILQGVSELIKHAAFLSGRDDSGSPHAPPPDDPVDDRPAIDRSVPVAGREHTPGSDA